MIPFSSIVQKAKEYRPDISKFLRDMIRIPSESCGEREVILRIKREMESVGFDRVEIDPMGNILGFLGNGKHLIAMDANPTMLPPVLAKFNQVLRPSGEVKSVPTTKI